MVLFSLVLSALVLTGCGGAEEAVTEEPGEEVEEEANGEDPGTEDEKRVFTMEEVAMYDGKDGNPAYIVVDGVVYDVTDVPQWGGAVHFGYEPGKDVTDALAAAPHGSGQLNSARIVGSVAD